jgi:mRNA interferase MazF
VGVVINQYEVYWVDLEPAKGSELKKTRPCIVISPDEMNHAISTVIIAPITSTSRNYPTRIRMHLKKKECWIVLDQIRCIDKGRLMQKAGTINNDTILEVKKIIREMLVD